MASMRKYLDVFLYVLIYFIVGSKCQYEVPPALVEPLYPRGLRVSIPDTPGIKLFAFHGNVNKDFENGHEIGDMAQDVLRTRNGRWTYTNREIKLKKGDTIYYWLHVIYDKLAYERLFQTHVVTDFFDEYDNRVDVPPEKPTPATPQRPPQEPPSRPDRPSSPTQKPPVCTNSITTRNKVQNQCKDSLIFDSKFENGILNDDWVHVVQFGDNDLDFTVLDNDRSNLYVEHDELIIKPIFLESKYGEQYASLQTLDLSNRCTSFILENCRRSALGRIILPPVISARIITKDSFSFRYGTIEVKAKLPRGDWVVPEIWLLPKSPRLGPNAGRVILAKSLGNNDLKIDGISRGNNYFYCGLEVGNKTIKYDYTIGSGSFSDDYHLFKMIWEPDQISFYYDNQPIGRWSSNDGKPLLDGQSDVIAPFNEEFYLVLGVHVGGIGGDFPDGLISNRKPKPWRDNKVDRRKLFYDDSANWLKTWSANTALRIAHVKVWAL